MIIRTVALIIAIVIASVTITATAFIIIVASCRVVNPMIRPFTMRTVFSTSTFVVVALILVMNNSFCIGSAPGVCEEPAAKFKKVLTIKPRQQWNIAGKCVV